MIKCLWIISLVWYVFTHQKNAIFCSLILGRIWKYWNFFIYMTDHAGPRGYECNPVFQIVTGLYAGSNLKYRVTLVPSDPAYCVHPLTYDLDICRQCLVPWSLPPRPPGRRCSRHLHQFMGCTNQRERWDEGKSQMKRWLRVEAFAGESTFLTKMDVKSKRD